MARATKSRAGFTLIETLAALAITSVIILSTGGLLYQSVFFFDRGTRTVDQGEQLALVIDSLTRDFGAARFAVQNSGASAKAAFTGTSASDDGPAKIVFVTAGGKAAGPQGEEIVSMTVEPGDEFEQLVRRRVAWRGPRMHLEDARPGDPVILIKGKLSISFAFSELTKDGKLVWHDSWTGDNGLPHSVRLNMRDGMTGANLLAGAEFPIHADASPACTAGKVDCLSLAANKNPDPGTQPGNQQPNQAR
jgi:prepilin-type N-terminal cleavage/methylation domain-containing protein